MSHEVDVWGFPVEQAERMQQAMLAFHDLQDAARMAEFSSESLSELRDLRTKFVEEFERRFPGYGKGRAVWK